MTERSVADQLADVASVRDTILSAAAAARGLPGSDPYDMTHAWVFTGPPGSGRSLAALAFAQALECETGTGCGHCEGCRAVAAGAHPDVTHYVPQGSRILVDDMRRLISTAYSLPQVGHWRVLIIDNADRFNESSANAMLKTVEEPPEHTVIIMCAPSIAEEDFMPTLRSRCRHVYIPAPSTSEIVRILVEEGASETDARLAAVASLHHVGRARRLVTIPSMQRRRAQTLNLAELIFHGDQAFQAVGDLVKAVKREVEETSADADAAELAKLENSLGMGGKGKGAAKAARGSAGQVKELEKEQKRRRTRKNLDVLDLALVDLAGLYRDALMYQAGVDGIESVHPDFEPLAREIAGQGDAAALIACQEAIAIARDQLQRNVTPQTALDGMIGRIRIAMKVR